MAYYTSSHQSGATFTPPPQTCGKYTPQSSIAINDVAIGGIVYLREKQEISPDALCDSELEDKSLNHPCLVLGVQPSPISIYDGRVRILLLTSLNGHNLSEKSVHQQGLHLPIAPTPAHPRQDEGFPTLTMHLGRLKKESYIKLHRTYDVHLSMLRCYDRTGGPHTHFLDAPSVNAILSLLKNPPRRLSISSRSPSPPTTPTSSPPAPHVRKYRYGPPSSIAIGALFQRIDGLWQQQVWCLDNYGYPLMYPLVYENPPCSHCPPPSPPWLPQRPCTHMCYLPPAPLHLALLTPPPSPPSYQGPPGAGAVFNSIWYPPPPPPPPPPAAHYLSSASPAVVPHQH